MKDKKRWTDDIPTLLGLLSFFTLQGGRPGIYLAPFLIREGWTEQALGVLLLVSGVFKMLIQNVVGSFVDSYKRKQQLIILANCMVSIPCLLLYNQSHPSFALLMALLCAISFGEAIAYPALYGITRGMTTQLYHSNYQWEQVVSENEQANHLGNVTFALLAGLLSLLVHHDRGYFFMIVACMGMISSLVIIFCVPDAKINDDIASGRKELTIAEDRNAIGVQTSMFDLYRDARVTTLLSVIFLFHLGNAAMLPLISQKLSLGNDNEEYEVFYTSLCILVAQLFMYFSSSCHGWLLETLSFSENMILLITLACVPIRGTLIAFTLSQPIISYGSATSKAYALISTQMLDGVAGGLIGVVSVVIMQNYASDHEGRWSFLLANVKTVEGAAAALSNFIGEMLAYNFNYMTSFITLSVIGVLPCVLCYAFMIKRQMKIGDDVRKSKALAQYIDEMTLNPIVQMKTPA